MLRDAGGRLRGLDTYGAKAAGMTLEQPELWIVIRHWERFQHYKERNPPWVKNYTRLLSDQNYLALSPTRRALLHGLWLAYALNDTSLRLDIKLLNTSLGLHAKMRDYEALNHAGYITIVASKPLAPRARSRETETETEKERTEQASKRTPSRAREHDDEDLFADVEKLLRPWPQ